MKTFVLPETYEGEGELELAGDDYHYLCVVRRLTAGSRFLATDPSGTRYEARITAIHDNSCRVTLRPSAEQPGGPDYAISLFQCIPKARKMDGIVRQATEAGVSAIVPVTSDYTVPRIHGDDEWGKRRRRWERIARQAVQQSGAITMPEIGEPISSDELAAGVRELDVLLFFHQIHLAEASLHGYLSRYPGRVGVIVGPEGGLSDREVSLMLESGALPVYLGPNVLRTETSAVFALAAIQIILREKESWTLAE
jgi:16S rRNA (uracil1498-N3)-methyltransferase